MNKEKLEDKLYNYTEKLVLEQLEFLLEEEYNEVCNCEDCVLDMATYALNRLTPQYVVSHKGEVYTKIKDFNQQSKVDIMSTVVKSIEIISTNPHDTNTSEHIE